jgi:hypothetical protein
MATCAECSDLLLDHLYGLLDEAEAQAVRDHLASCLACQAALAQAEAQQSLIARAAQVYAEVPAFTAPAAEPAEAPALATATAETAAVTLPLPKPRRRKPWAWLSAAAGLLLAVLGFYGVHVYQEGLASRQESLRLARGEVKRVDEGFAEAQLAYRQQLAALPVSLQGDYLYLGVTGPASYSPSSGGRYHVVTRGPEGDAAHSKVTVRLVDPVPAPGRTLFEKQVESQGEATLTLPAGLDVRPGSLPRLEVEARTGKAPARVEEVLSVPVPAYATHLATSKPAYRTGEILFFRSLTLERFSLKPPEKELHLSYTLFGPDNQPVLRLDGLTRHGIGGGEIALAPDLKEGMYTLQVSAAGSGDGKSPQVLAESRRLRVVRAEVSRLEFNRPQYAPGEKGVASFTGRRLPDGKPVANQPVVVEAELNGKPVPLAGSAPGKPLQLRTDAEGKALIPFLIPPGTSVLDNAQLRMKAEVHDGRGNEKVTREATVAARRGSAQAVAVDFFPEGGELVAGLPARVYFLAQDAQGQPVALEGRILDREGRVAARVRTEEGAPGTGVFAFTPTAGAFYRLETLPPSGPVPPAAVPTTVVPLPTVKPEGVTLIVPDAVAAEGAPLRVTVHDSVPGRNLLVVATCRGRLVDQRAVIGKPEEATVELHPVPGTRGLVRITVCETRTGTLLPLAERLVYRAPAEYLVLSAVSADGKALPRYRAGAQVDVTVKAKRENGQPAEPWLLGMVVDEGALCEAGRETEEGPAARFYLTREIRQPQDLEDAHILLANTAKARRALDLFLGTHGWRRIVRTDQEGEAVAELSVKEARTRALSGLPAVLLADNGRQMVKERYLAALSARRQALREQAERTWAGLKAERERRAEDARLASAELERYEARPREYIAQGVTVLLLGLFAAGGLFLALGLVRIARGARSAAPSFAAACGALVLCAVTYLMTADLRTPAEVPNRDPRLAELDSKAGALPEVLPADQGGGRLRDDEQSRPGGLLVLGDDRKTADERLTQATTDPRSVQTHGLRDSAAKAKSGTGLSYGAPSATDVAQMAPESSKGKGRQPTTTAGDLRRRFDDRMESQRALLMMKGAKGGGAPGGMPAPGKAIPVTPTAGRGKADGPGGAAKEADRTADKKAGDAKPSARVGTVVLQEYVHRRRTGGPDFQDTLFWHPSLHAAGGTARLRFDLADGARTYRLLLYGHDAAGRLGTYRGKIEAGD